MVAISLVVSDIEDKLLVSSKITQLPNSAQGTLYHVNNNMPVQVNDTIAASASNTVKFVPAPYTCCEVVYFRYTAVDSGLLVSSDILIIIICFFSFI